MGSRSQDPGAFVGDWLTTGAPAGIKHHFKLGTLFPLHTEDRVQDSTPDMLDTNFEDFVNYVGGR